MGSCGMREGNKSRESTTSTGTSVVFFLFYCGSMLKCLCLCSSGFTLWLREICISSVGTEGKQCQPGTWCLIFAHQCPSCPVGCFFCYCWAACNSPLRRTVSTTFQLTSHFSCVRTLRNWKRFASWNCLQAWVNSLMFHSRGTKWTRNSNKP